MLLLCPAMAATIKLEFSLSPKALAIIDELRGDRSREQIFRQVIQLGLCELIERAAQMDRDYLTHEIAGETMDYKQGRRALFQVDAPKTEKSAGDRPDPTPNHVPRGVRG